MKNNNNVELAYNSIVKETEPEEMEKRLAELRAEAAKLMKGRLDDRKIDRIIEICAEIRKIRGEE